MKEGERDKTQEKGEQYKKSEAQEKVSFYS